MQGETKEHWMELAQQAANQQNPAKLIKLTEEIPLCFKPRRNGWKWRRSKAFLGSPRREYVPASTVFQ
jgi:hypothetical protein